MRNTKHILVILIIICLVTLVSCRQLDVVGNKSISSFEEVLNTIPDNVQADSKKAGWVLKAPDGTAEFFLSSDFSKTSENDVLMRLDAQPFVDAGLDISKLPEGMIEGDTLLIGAELGNSSPDDAAEVTPLKAYEQLVYEYREKLSFHSELGHFGISVGDGNVFEWAKDMKENDKDMVFALNPQAFQEAGADIQQIDGWTYAQVDTMDENGKPIKIYKLLKPFNLKD